MDAAAELRRNSVSKHQIQPEYGDEQADGGTRLPNLSRETKFSGTNADREFFIFPVQLTTCWTGNLIWLIHTLAICVTIQGCFERVLPWQVTMDQLICASLSLTHYWYEVGMLKVPAIHQNRAKETRWTWYSVM